VNLTITELIMLAKARDERKLENGNWLKGDGRARPFGCRAPMEPQAVAIPGEGPELQEKNTMSAYTKALFIGGTKDGQMLEVNIEYPYWNVPLPPSHNSFHMQVEQYQREKIVAYSQSNQGEQAFVFYMHQSLSMNDAVRLLINNYRPEMKGQA
jgi:hypothetical protein